MNTTSLAIIDGQELDTLQRVAKMLAASGYFDGKGESTQAIAMMATKILAGREMGFGPFASVNGVYIISGRPSIGANLMAAAVKGSARYDYRVREMSDKRCAIEFFERVGDKLESIGISEFSKEDATKAGTKNMDKWAKNMLFARAMSNGVRWYCPDVFSGNAVYVPEELGANTDADGNVIESTYTVAKPAALIERSVDAATGEILQPDASVPAEHAAHDDLWQTETYDAPASASRKDKVLSAAQLTRLHVLGSQVYRDGWDVQRKKLVEAVSKGAISSSKELSPDEATTLIFGMEKKLAEYAAQVQSTGTRAPVANGNGKALVAA